MTGRIQAKVDICERERAIASSDPRAVTCADPGRGSGLDEASIPVERNKRMNETFAFDVCRGFQEPVNT
jgi:hypothetical protein